MATIHFFKYFLIANDFHTIYELSQILYPIFGDYRSKTSLTHVRKTATPPAINSTAKSCPQLAKLKDKFEKKPRNKCLSETHS
jgi:hypothetical protein